MQLNPTQVKAALAIYVRRLTGLAESSEKVGETTTAAAVRAKLGLAQTFMDETPPKDAEDLSGEQREMLRKAMNLLVINLKAGSGTVLALGKDAWAATLTEEAEALQAAVLPQLDEQRSLRLEPSAAVGSGG